MPSHGDVEKTYYDDEIHSDTQAVNDVKPPTNDKDPGIGDIAAVQGYDVGSHPRPSTNDP